MPEGTLSAEAKCEKPMSVAESGPGGHGDPGPCGSRPLEGVPTLGLTLRYDMNLYEGGFPVERRPAESIPEPVATAPEP